MQCIVLKSINTKRERGRERKKECERGHKRERANVRECARKRKKKSEKTRESVCVCVREKERERGRDIIRNARALPDSGGTTTEAIPVTTATGDDNDGAGSAATEGVFACAILEACEGVHTDADAGTDAGLDVGVGVDAAARLAAVASILSEFSRRLLSLLSLTPILLLRSVP